MFKGGATALTRTGKKIAAQAAAGAPIGAIYGAGVSDEGERLEGAVEGAAIAAVAGPVLGAAAGTASRAVKGVTKLMQGSELRTFNKATQQIARSVKRDGDTTAELGEKKKNLGPEATLADAGKVNLKRELERAASTPGKAPEIVERTLIGRLARSGVRIQQVFDKHIGRNTQSATKTIEGIAEDASTRARPHYEKAYEAKIDNTTSGITKIIADTGGVVGEIKHWGKRKLAYPIKKFSEGNYVLTNFQLQPASSKELEAKLQISEDILRHLLVRLGV